MFSNPELPAGVADQRAYVVTLDDAYRQVAAELARGNGQAVIENGQIHLERLGPAPETPGLQQERGEMARMMPRVDLPEVLLEIFARTGVVDPRYSWSAPAAGEHPWPVS